MDPTTVSGANFAIRSSRGREACDEGTKLGDHLDSKCNSVYDSGCIDSGFHSGANLSSEQFVSEEIRSSRHGSDTELDPPTKSVDSDSKSYTRLDSGVDLCLNDQFSSLNLRSTNDLNEPPSKSPMYLPNINVPTVECTTVSPSEKSTPSPAPWEFYYQQNEEGDTQLHCAVIQGFIEAVYALIHVAPEPFALDIQNDDCQTALHLAVLTGQAGVARRLLVAGASLSPRDRHGNTALHMASAEGNLEVLKALLEPLPSRPPRPLELDQRNYDGMMCVHLAALNGHAAALQYLVCAGANINAREAKSGRTVLHLAVEYERTAVLQLLLEDVLQLLQLDATTYAGHTAYQLASCVDAALANRLATRGAQPRAFPVDDSSEDEDDEEMYRAYHGNCFQQLATQITS
ncbi:NF-kappa-B inhibitor cactus [Frankliniella occidentalis]|uniref:NF-kappa-B inhibitor cactus n=1 Tax=Frankliniella occidentalis TaxID=133901 RepID=A0A9C6U7R2_FRAOC|nr:NF-kappa-B inhibitor cactus [Frankliniella occidentalis]